MTAYGVFDREFGFGSHDWSFSQAPIWPTLLSTPSAFVASASSSSASRRVNPRGIVTGGVLARLAPNEPIRIDSICLHRVAVSLARLSMTVRYHNKLILIGDVTNVRLGLHDAWTPDATRKAAAPPGRAAPLGRAKVKITVKNAVCM